MARGATAKKIETTPMAERDREREINEIEFGEWDRVIQPHQSRKRQQRREALARVETNALPSKTHPAHAAKRKIAFKSEALIVVCFIMLVLMLFTYAKTVSANLEKNDIQSEITDLQAKIERLQMQVDSGAATESIQERAAEMGLGFPKESQIQYINTDQ